jgi:hypothetical protein
VTIVLPLSLPGSGPSSSKRAAATRALKAAVRTRFGLGEDDSVFIAEITCGETECLDVETVIAVFLDGQRRQFKLHKPVGAITPDDLPALAGRPVHLLNRSETSC